MATVSPWTQSSVLFALSFLFSDRELKCEQMFVTVGRRQGPPQTIWGTNRKDKKKVRCDDKIPFSSTFCVLTEYMGAVSVRLLPVVADEIKPAIKGAFGYVFILFFGVKINNQSELSVLLLPRRSLTFRPIKVSLVEGQGGCRLLQYVLVNTFGRLTFQHQLQKTKTKINK